MGRDCPSRAAGERHGCVLPARDDRLRRRAVDGVGVGGLTGAAHGERSPERLAQRKGCRERDWETRAGTVELRIPKLAALMDSAEEDVLAFMAFPKEHRAKIHSTNPLERVNGEIKRRTDVVGTFPNKAAITRLVGAILLEQNDEWATQRRSMSLETLAPISDAQPSACQPWRPDRGSTPPRSPSRSYTITRDTTSAPTCVPAAKVGPLAPGHRCSVARKREVVLRLLRGESAELLSRELGVPIFKLQQWRRKADAALDGALKERKADIAGTDLAAAMQRIGELGMEVELLRTRIERPGPLARWRSR